jgi:zinc protease
MPAPGTKTCRGWIEKAGSIRQRAKDVPVRDPTFDIPFVKHTLANGLDVVLHEDHTCPIAAVNIWYHVGSKDEQRGHTGFAHLFEHLMFEGSEHHDSGYFEPLQQAGGQLNGSTNTDRTNYWEVVPSQALDLALWMESDRMGFLLPALTLAKFQNQRDVVLNERRQNYENRPYGLVSVILAEALFPPEHPYSWLTIGSPDDLRAASLEDVHAFFRRYYHPSNASLAIAGDVDPVRTLDLVEQCFGDIPGGDKPIPVPPTPRPTAPPRLAMEDRVELPRLYLAWITPRLYAEDDADLDLLADILAGGKASRLYRRLVYDERVATEVAAYQNSREAGGYFQVVATAVPGVGLDVIEDLLVEELDRFAAEGPTGDELARAVALTESGFLSRLEHVGGFGGKSDQLNSYNVVIGDPGYFATDLGRYRQASHTSVRQAAATHLKTSDAVRVSVVPTGRLELAAPSSRKVTAS